uniref:Noggin n=1 Tax=Xenopus tropicalis TaxID=8364 RepID=A0A803J898_XENTR
SYGGLPASFLHLSWPYLIHYRGGRQPYVWQCPFPSEDYPYGRKLEHPEPEQPKHSHDIEQRTRIPKLHQSVDPNFVTLLLRLSKNVGTTDQLNILEAGGSRPLQPYKAETVESVPMGGLYSVGAKGRTLSINWLIMYTQVCLLYRDKYTEIRNWGRYIEEHHNLSERRCTCPHGLLCKVIKPVASASIRWMCQSWISQIFFFWIPATWPIVSSCECKC